MIRFVLISLILLQVVIFSEEEIMMCDNFKQEIKEAIHMKIKAQYSQLEFNEILVTDSNKSAKMDCNYVKFDFPKKNNLRKNMVIKFNAYDENDNFLKRITKVFSISGKVAVFRTNEKAFPRNKVGKHVLVKDEIDISDVSIHMISKVIDNETYEFKSFVDKHQIIEGWMIQKIPDIKMGDLVKAIYQKGNIMLTLDAYVMENGNIGEELKLKLKKNQKIMIGKAYDAETIIISSR